MKSKNPIEWIRNLPEVGAAMRAWVDRWDDAEKDIKEAERKIHNLKERQRMIIRQATRDARSQWAGNEIEQAKASANV